MDPVRRFNRRVGGLSRRLLLRRALGLGASAIGIATFTACSFMFAAPKQARMPRIGVLLPGPDLSDPSSPLAIRDGLREAGWIAGQTITVEWRSAEGDFDRMPFLAAELVSMPVELIATVSSPATAAAKQATSTIPIVFCSNGDPVGDGFVHSLAHPGGNLTGTTQAPTVIPGKRLSLLKELLPGLVRVVVMPTPCGPRGDLQEAEQRVRVRFVARLALQGRRASSRRTRGPANCAPSARRPQPRRRDIGLTARSRRTRVRQIHRGKRVWNGALLRGGRGRQVED
jgi:hypothetical protein